MGNGGTGCAKVFGITMLVVCALGLGTCALLVGLGMWASNQPSAPRQSGQPSATRSKPMPTEHPSRTNQRLFLEEHRADDSAREYIFRTTLRKSGERCDSVESALMSRTGVWTVRCPPGHVVVFTFDQMGDLKEARKLR